MNTIKRIRNKATLEPSDIGRYYLASNLEPLLKYKVQAKELLNEETDQEWFNNQLNTLDSAGHGVFGRYALLSNWLYIMTFYGKNAYNRALAISKGLELEIHTSIAVAEAALSIAEHQQQDAMENADITAKCLDKLDSYWFTKYNNDSKLKEYLKSDFEELKRNYKELLEVKMFFHILAVKLDIPELEYLNNSTDIKIISNCFEELETLRHALKDIVEKMVFLPTEERNQLSNDPLEIFPDFTVYKTIRVYRPYATKARNMVDVNLSKFNEMNFNSLLETIKGN